MGSRLKQNPERTFYWFFEATCPVSRDTDPGVQFQFPEDLRDEESRQTLPRFCFPYDIQKVRDGVAVQHFTFVLTDLEGSQRFGFCRLTNVTRTCLCMLSYLPWFEVFYKLLNNLADYLAKGQTNEMKALLAALYKQPVPLSPGCVTLQMGEQLLNSTELSHHIGHLEGQEGVPYFIAPDPRSLPSIPENRNLTELIVAVDVGNLLQLYASMLFERRILIFASKLSTLTSCVHALSAALYPMYWQHIFIPVLPPHLLDYCCAPMPYLIGVHTSLSERVRSRGLEEVVILNVDSNTLETPFEDLKRIPSDVMAGLKVCLKRQALAPGCGVSRAFLNAQALLFGGYRDALQSHEDGELWFSEELFLGHRSSSMRQFLQGAVHLQFFKQFIDSRLDILNKGKEPDDLFEEEIQKCETTAGKSKSYQQLVGNLKKGGGALILNMKSKANIKAKGLTKSGLKNLLIHKAHNEEPTLQRGGSVSHRRAQSDCLQNRLPITQHFGKSRPRRPVHKATTGEQDETDAADSWNGAPSEPAIMPEPDTVEEERDDSLLCDSEEMDLLGEIFDTLSSRSSHDRGLLYGTRSLDLFGLDSHDFIMKRDFPANPSQESLSLSISGSGSLHSWNLETTEEHSDLTEDSDWLSLNASVPEEERMEILSAVHENLGESNGQKEEEEKQEEAKVATDGEGAEDSRNCKEGETEEEKDGVSHEKRVGPGEDSDEREEEESKEEKEVEENQMAEEPEGQEPERTDEMLKDRKEEQQGGEDQEDSKTTDSLKVIELTPPCPSTGEEQPRQEDPTAAASSSLTADSEPPAGQGRRHDEAKDLQEKRQTPPPKVLSAVARFQSQALRPGFQVKTRAKELAETRRPDEKLWYRENVQTLSNTSEENQRSEEEEPSLIKVSELKKRFEA